MSDIKPTAGSFEALHPLEQERIEHAIKRCLEQTLVVRVRPAFIPAITVTLGFNAPSEERR